MPDLAMSPVGSAISSGCFWRVVVVVEKGLGGC